MVLQIETLVRADETYSAIILEVNVAALVRSGIANRWSDTVPFEERLYGQRLRAAIDSERSSTSPEAHTVSTSDNATVPRRRMRQLKPMVRSNAPEFTVADDQPSRVEARYRVFRLTKKAKQLGRFRVRIDLKGWPLELFNSVFASFSHVQNPEAGSKDQLADGSYPIQRVKAHPAVQTADAARRGEGIYDRVSSLTIGDRRLHHWCSFEAFGNKGSGATVKKSSETMAMILELIAVVRLNPFASTRSQTSCYILVTTGLHVALDVHIRSPPACNHLPFFVDIVLPSARKFLLDRDSNFGQPHEVLAVDDSDSSQIESERAMDSSDSESSSIDESHVTCDNLVLCCSPEY